MSLGAVETAVFAEALRTANARSSASAASRRSPVYAGMAAKSHFTSTTLTGGSRPECVVRRWDLSVSFRQNLPFAALSRMAAPCHVRSIGPRTSSPNTVIAAVGEANVAPTVDVRHRNGVG